MATNQWPLLVEYWRNQLVRIAQRLRDSRIVRIQTSSNPATLEGHVCSNLGGVSPQLRALLRFLFSTAAEEGQTFYIG